jgi:membrane protease YdiL (CAAX protease family)
MIEKNENFPNAIEAFFLVVMLFGAEYLAGAALYDMRGFMGLDPLDLSGLATVLGNAVIFTIVMHFKGLSYRQLFHSSPSSVAATLFVLVPAIALTIPALIIVVSSLVLVVAHLVPLSAGEQAMFGRLGSGSFGAFVLIGVLAPVLEEMLFRGVILRSFLNQYSKWTAIVGSAALFGFAHLNIYQFAVGLVLGVFLGWLYERTRSLWPCICLHAGYNLTLLMAFNDVVPGSDSGPNFLASWFLVAALLSGIAGTVMLRRVLIVPAGRRSEKIL